MEHRPPGRVTGSTLVDTKAMLPATVRASTYKDVLYAAPVSTDAGILYYRKDLVPNPPKTGDEMMGMCSIAKANTMGCYAGQSAKYEGLTAKVAEAISSAGGTILGPDGSRRSVLPRPKGAAEPDDGIRRREHPAGSHHLPGGAGPHRH